MDLQSIALAGAWRELVTPSLRTPLSRLETQGVNFFWTREEPAGTGAYRFNAGVDGAVIASRDGSEMPRQAISEVILEAMTARGLFSPAEGSPGRNRRGAPQPQARPE